eukprot:3864623-Pleurochrysis_carterae.AAC.5
MCRGSQTKRERRNTSRDDGMSTVNLLCMLGAETNTYEVTGWPTMADAIDAAIRATPWVSTSRSLQMTSCSQHA